MFLALFYFYPLGRIFQFSFTSDNGWETQGLLQIFSEKTYGKILWFTTWQAALSTVLTVATALPGAYLFFRYRFPGKNILQALLTIPFVLPTVVVAAAFRAFLGSHGIANEFLMRCFDLSTPPIQIEGTLWFFLLAHVFYNYSLVLRIVSSYWAGLGDDLRAAAAMLGASPWQTFRKITLPLLAPAIGSASLLVFIFCFTSFGVILILGGPGFATIEVEIYRQSIQLFNLPMAATLSIIQIGINFLLMLVHARLSRNASVGFFEGGSGGQAPLNSLFRQLFAAGNLIAMFFLLGAPLAALFLSSISGTDGLTLAYYQALATADSRSVFMVKPAEAIINSLGFATIAMLIAIILGVISSSYLDRKKSSLWEGVVMLPLATSAVTLGFGYIISLGRPPFNLRDSLALVPIAHALVAFPFVVRCILPSLKQIPGTLYESAALLGASPWNVWRHITLPLIRKAVVIGGIFAFIISMGEFGASAFVVRPHLPTMPVAIFRFLGQPGAMNYGQAMAMSTILMLVSCCCFLLLGSFERSRK